MPRKLVFYIELYIANKVSLLEKKIKAFSSINQTNVFNKQLSEPMVILGPSVRGFHHLIAEEMSGTV